jgi:hypothetical protein
MQKIRYMDKLVDKVAKGMTMENILRRKKNQNAGLFRTYD